MTKEKPIKYLMTQILNLNFLCVTLTRPFALLSILEVYNLRNLRSNVYCEDVLVTLIQVNADKKHIP